MAIIFISHSSRDESFARRLAMALIEQGHQPWLDEWEIKVGESIAAKIEGGLKEADFVAVVLTKHSAASAWVDREWKAKYWDEINRKSSRSGTPVPDGCRFAGDLKCPTSSPSSTSTPPTPASKTWASRMTRRIGGARI